MKIRDHKDGKLILLSTTLDSRAKGLALFNFILFFAFGTFFLWLFLKTEDNTAGVIVSGIATIVFYIAAYRFGNKAVAVEKLVVNKERLDLIKSGLFNSKKQSFDITKISGFRHLSKPSLTKHPLSGDSFDYLGFQTQQQVINDMHGDNRLAFDYDGRTITFGNHVYSWEFEELEVLLYDITGNDFRYHDDFEKNFTSE